VKNLFSIAVLTFVSMAVYAQTNLVEYKMVSTTNWYRGPNNMRLVGKLLYNTDVNAGWVSLEGDCVEVASNYAIVSTFTMKPIYQTMVVTKIVHRGIYDGVGEPRMVPEKVQVDSEKEKGKTILLLNATTPSTGQSFNFMAMQVGATNYGNQAMEIWDCGKPWIYCKVQIKRVNTNAHW
jgi:hypothetical protein